jgi:hypothetical protein
MSNWRMVCIADYTAEARLDVNYIYPNVFDIRHFRSDATKAFTLALRRETAAIAYPFPYPSPLKKQVSSKAMSI